ncbi:MAG: arylsulfatase [Spirochaetales bacterium]|nr:arylsulfatase [Spirochaetales bacterium]
MNKPNIVFVLTDDQGSGDLGCNGNPWIKTPHIDAFYNESCRLSDFHVGPTCAPTRASLMTGHYANSTGVWHTVGGRSLLRKNEVSLASALAASGYTNGIFGKWHLGDNAPYRAMDRGFHKTLVHGGGGISQAPDWWGNDYFDDTYLEDGQPKAFKGHCTDVWFDEAEQFIRENREKPFFCYIACNAPHSPYNIMKEYSDPYRGGLDTEDDENRSRFYGMISHIDERFGRLRETLNRLELEENTILIFMTDNGTSCGGEFDEEGHLLNGWNHGLRGMKCSEYEGGHRVPFFLRWPAGGYREQREIASLTSVVDIMPTLLDLCAVDHSLDFHGESLVPRLDDPSLENSRIVVTDSQRVPDPVMWKQSCAMTGSWRLINGKELYNLDSDRAQRNDIAPDHPDMVETLRRGYEQWWDLVKPDFDSEIPIEIGGSVKEVRLSSHDWRNDDGELVWNQKQVREGLPLNGYWEVEILKPGQYEIELCRWPREGCGQFLSEGPGEDDVKWDKEGVAPDSVDFYSGGRALEITEAECRVAGLTMKTRAGERVVFRMELPAGPAHLETVLRTAGGVELGAYYCYVRTGSKETF